MNFKSTSVFSETYKGKYIRFKTAFNAVNLSHQMGVNTVLPEQIPIPMGAIGLIYVVRGATMFVGFNKDFKSLPSRGTSPTFFDATIQLGIGMISRIEIEF